jgi:hypothetical protein
VSFCGLAIYIKNYLKAKKELWKTQIFHQCKNITFKKSSKRNQNPSRYLLYNSITNNLKFQHKPKYSFFRNPRIKIDLLLLLLLPRGQNPLFYTFFKNSKKKGLGNFNEVNFFYSSCGFIWENAGVFFFF